MTDSLNMSGRSVVVTGAGRNIGRAIALEFARAGANVLINTRSNVEEASAVAEEARAFGVKAVTVIGDVGNPETADEILARAKTEFGGVDTYVSSAAVRHRQPFLEITDEDWNGIIASNLSASFYLARRIVPLMIEAKWGRIIHISGREGFFASVFRSHNVTAKAGMHGFTKALARELGPHGITANTVVPGSIDTTRDPVHYPDQNPVTRPTTIPVGRVGQPEEIAWLCLFLASKRSGYINGQAIHSNGGESLY